MGGRNNILLTSIDHTLLDIFQKYGYYVFQQDHVTFVCQYFEVDWSVGQTLRIYISFNFNPTINYLNPYTQ